jgi:type III restriction enzyme
MIGITLKYFQERAVDFLFEKTTDSTTKPKIVLKSPTGSGKTVILVAYIEKFLTFHENTVFCWLCPGKGNLEEQSEEKMHRFAPGLKTGNVLDIINGGFEERTTYFINWEMITKKDNTALKDSERKNLFERISEAHRKNLNFIIIIDEEHQNNTSKADDIISSLNARYEIRVSATPSKRVMGEYYEIDEVDVIDDGLITRFMYINDGLEHLKIENTRHETDLLLEKADDVRKQIAEAYKEEGESVRPLVLVQFPSLSDDFIEYVENKLNDMGYSYENKLLASWFSAENTSDKKRNSKKLGKINIGTTKQDSITNHDATPVFLLFKQALSTGWDCPRAKILVKLRERMSEVFEIQTLGRLRRMPYAKHYGKDILDCSYLYTFDEKYKLEVINAGNAFETQRVFLKEAPKKITLVKELRDRDADIIDESAVRSRVFEYYRDNYHLTGKKEENRAKLEIRGFIFGSTLKQRYLKGKFSTLRAIKESASSYGDLEIEVNTHTHGIDLQHNIDALKGFVGLGYSKTNQVLKTLFLKGFGNRKYKFLNLSLQEYYAFVINNADLIKEDFSKISSDARNMALPTTKSELIRIPLEEHYRYTPYEKNMDELERNVYKGYNSSMITDLLRSSSERLFEWYCENNKDVEHIYKNGDSGQKYLSIVYTDSLGRQRLFYPDYVLKMQDGAIWLIETKGGEWKGESKNIDPYAEIKFNALKAFCKKHNYQFGFVRDRDSRLFINNEKYTDDMQGEHWVLIDKVF